MTLQKNHLTEIEEPLPGVPWRALKSSASDAFGQLAKAEGYHALDVEDCRHKRQIAKVVERESYVFIVAKVARYEPKSLHLTFHDFDLFVTPTSLVTVEEYAGGLIQRVQDRIPDSAHHPHTPDIAHVIYALFDEIVDEYLTLLDGIGESVNALEGHIWRSPTPEMLERIFQLKRALIEFRRNAGGMREVVSLLIRHPRIKTDGHLENYYRDLYEHTIRIIEFIEMYRDILSGTLDIYLSAVANRTNEVVKVLTIYGTIALPLIVVTGFYGMNISLPFQNSPHALTTVAALMTVCTVSVLLYFKKKEWF